MDLLISGTAECLGKSKQACQAVKYLDCLESVSRVVNLEKGLHAMVLEETLNKASKIVVQLSKYVLNLNVADTASSAGAVPQEEFQAFQMAQAESLVAICQELKGGRLRWEELRSMARTFVYCKRTHLTWELTYQCISSLMFAMSMPLERRSFSGMIWCRGMRSLRPEH